jgi:hypothetical protein
MESRKRFGSGGSHSSKTTTTTLPWNAFSSRSQEQPHGWATTKRSGTFPQISRNNADDVPKTTRANETELVEDTIHDSPKEVFEDITATPIDSKGIAFAEETTTAHKVSNIADMKAKLWGSGSGGKLIVSQPDPAMQSSPPWVDTSSLAPSSSVVTGENGPNLESPEGSLVQPELFASPERTVRGQPDVSTPYGPSLPGRDSEPSMSVATVALEQKPVLESFDGNATVFQSEESFVVDPPRPKETYVVSPQKSDSWVARRMKALPPSPHRAKPWPKLQLKKEEKQPRELKVDTSVIAHEPPKGSAPTLSHYRSPSVGVFQISTKDQPSTGCVEPPAETRSSSSVEKPYVFRSPSMGDSPVEAAAKGMFGEETTPEEVPSSSPPPHTMESSESVEEDSTSPKEVATSSPTNASDIHHEEKVSESSPTPNVNEETNSPMKLRTGYSATTHPSAASLSLPPISPREKIRPWNKDVNMLSPKSWQRRSMDIDALSITSPSVPVRRPMEGQEEKESFEESFMAVQKSPSSLGQLAAQSIHAIDFEKTVRSIPKRTLSEETDGSTNSMEHEGSAIPANVPPEFSLAVSETSDIKVQREIPVEETKDQSPIIFGDEKLIAKVDSDQGTTKPIHVPDMAKALTNWNGGLGVIAPKVNKQDIYRREIARESSPLRRTKSEESEFSDVIFSGFKKRGVAIEDWQQRTKSFDSECRRSQHDNANSSDFWMPAKLDDSVADENEWTRGAKKNVENKAVDQNKSPARDPFDSGQILQDAHGLNIENNAADACDWSGRDPEIVISPSSASDAVTHASDKKSISSFALGLSKRDTSTIRRKSNGSINRKSRTDKVVKNGSIAKKTEPIFDPWGVDGTTQGDFTETTADPTDSTDFFGFDPFGASDFGIKEYMPKPIEEDLRHEDHQGYYSDDISKQVKQSEGSVASLHMIESEASVPMNDESSFWSYDADTSTVQLEI